MAVAEAIARLLQKNTKKKESPRAVLVVVMDKHRLQLFLVETTMARKETHMDVVIALSLVAAAVGIAAVAPSSLFRSSSDCHHNY